MMTIQIDVSSVFLEIRITMAFQRFEHRYADFGEQNRTERSCGLDCNIKLFNIEACGPSNDAV